MEEQPMSGERTQEDFVKDLNFGDIDPNDPLTNAALSDPVENEWIDVLGNGQLRKKTITKGDPNTRPNRNDICTLNIFGKLADGTEVEAVKGAVVQLGDVEIVQGLDLAVGLMDVGEVAEIEVASRFAYGDRGKEPNIPPGATIYYNVELTSVQMEPDMEEMNFEKRREIATKKRERGNWWFARDEPALAIQCYRRALEVLEPSGEDYSKKSDNFMTDPELKLLLQDKTKIYNNLAASQIKTESYEAALQSVENVLRVEPENVKALFRKGRILHKQGEHASAMTVLQTAAKLDPSSREITRELSILKEKSAKDTLHEKNLYRKMLGSSNENNETPKKSEPPSSGGKGKLAWGLLGGTAVALASVIFFRLSF